MGRKYQLTIYGATGFTGRLAAAYVKDRYASLRWAVAGRSKAKLEALGSGADVVVAEADDEAALRRLAEGTDVVVACAGPFARYGSKLVAACVAAGTDYVDITGEADWVRQMIAVHHDAARASGARIVHLCGHDSVPWDLMTLMLAKKLQQPLKRVDMHDNYRTAPSGGTLETAFGIAFGKKDPQPPAVRALGYDPLLKTSDGRSESVVKNRSVGFLGVDASVPSPGGQHRTAFVMASVNAAAVKRSNALNGYGDAVVYCEGTAHRSAAGAYCSMVKMLLTGLALAIPPLRWLARKFVLPSPGEGPSAEAMANGYLTVYGSAVGADGATARASMHFAVDPGYQDTARMVVESGLCLALDSVARPGGVYTPAACQGEKLLDRLRATGTAFEYL